MSLFKKPSELQVKAGLVAMIYGQPGSGKSTLACSAPNAVMFDTDGGVNRINGAHQIPTLQVTRWEEIMAGMQEARDTPQIQSIIIDTVGKMMAFMEDYIKRTATGKKDELKRDGTLSIKGYGKRKQMFVDFIKMATTMGKNVIFVGHDKEEKRGDDTIIRPEVGGSSTNDLMKELDLVGYVEMNGNIRTITFTPTDRYYAKNTCDMDGIIPIPILINKDKEIIGTNNFFAQVIKAYNQRIQTNIENNRKLEELRELILANAEAVTNAEEANNFIEWVIGLEHIYNSKAIANQAISRKAKELQLTFDKTKKQYISNEPQTDEPQTENTATTDNGDAA